MNGLRVQILPSMLELPQAKKHQFAAFLAAEGLLVLWDDKATALVHRAKRIELELLDLVWEAGQPENGIDLEKMAPPMEDFKVDEESAEHPALKRVTRLQNAVLVACTIVLVMLMLGAGIRSVAIEVAIDKNYLRLAFLALTPVQIFFTLVC